MIRSLNFRGVEINIYLSKITPKNEYLQFISITQRFWVQLAQKCVTGYCPGKSHNKFKEKKKKNIILYAVNEMNHE